MGELRFLWIDCTDKKISGDNFILNRPKLLFPFPSLQESNTENHRSFSSIKTKASQFLQKLSCQKPYWDQARLSSLVNKQVGRRGAGRHGAGTGSYGAGRRVAGRRISGCQAKSARQTAVRCGTSCLQSTALSLSVPPSAPLPWRCWVPWEGPSTSCRP